MCIFLYSLGYEYNNVVIDLALIVQIQLQQKIKLNLYHISKVEVIQSLERKRLLTHMM